jgi:general secretion pathway protein C
MRLPFFVASLVACAPSTPAPASATAPTSASSPELRLARIRESIVHTSPTQVVLDRVTVDEIFDHEHELVSDVRIVPEQEAGTVVGLRIFGAPPDSLLGALGIKNGDRVQTVNGRDVTDGDTARAMLAELPKAKHVTVVLNRGGRDMTLDYDVK